MAWTNMGTKANGVVIDQGDWNQMVANFSWLGGADGNTKTGNILASGLFRAGNATAGAGGNYQSVDDGGTLRYTSGVLGTVGARDYSIHDLVNGTTFFTYTNAGTITIAARAGSIFVNTPGGFFGPATDGGNNCGNTANRWAAVYAVNGTIQTSRREDKQVGARVTPGTAIQKIRTLPVHRFRYLRPDGEPDPDLEHVGFMADEAPPELLVAPGMVNAQTTASYALVCIQELAARVEALEAAAAPGPGGGGGR
jgi:hypothetical protein